MRSRAIEMFLAVGVAATVSACGGETPNPGGQSGEGVITPQPVPTQPANQGGEGGEDGVSTPQPTETQGGEGGEGGES